MKPPYYAVIFTSTLNQEHEGYDEEADKILSLAEKQKGFLGFESARDQIGISISYWESLVDIQNWKNQTDHLKAQEKGKSDWYATYRVRIAKVERDYSSF